MIIRKDSEKILRILYNSLDEKSYSLSIEIQLVQIADQMKITREYANLCLWYLNNKGYIDCDPTFNRDVDAKKTIILNAVGVDLVESKI